MENKYLEQIQRGAKCANFYDATKEVLSRLKKPTTQIENQSHALLFVEKSRYDFWRCYFYIQDIAKVNWAIFKEKTLITEIVVRKSKIEKWKSILEVFEKNGAFIIYDAYMRFAKELPETTFKNLDFSNIQTSQEEDLVDIQQLIETNFNSYSDKIPSVDELKLLTKSTFLIKEKGEIVAFFITEKKGTTLEFRYWLVLEQYRGRRYGERLINRVLTHDPEIRRVTSWVSQKNKSVIRVHKKLGFKEDGLINYILYRK
tara:strand:+ start:218 stop:991 length:774 start_codon:yes stop_codon:yes gene_type:complete